MSTITKLKAPRTGELSTDSYSIGTVTLAPGTRGTGDIPVAIGSNGEAISIPLSVVHGKYPGPVLAVGAGIHGDEYDSMQAVREAIEAIDPETLHGTFVGMPCINIAAFAAATRVSGLDYLNFNRIFPGDSDGSISMRLAAIFITDVVPYVDAFVDLHTGGTFGEITPLVVVQRGYEDIATELGMASGNPVIWKGGNWGGTARSSFLAVGKPAVTLEAGGGTYKGSVVKHHFDSIMNIVRHLDMVDGDSVLCEGYEAVNATFARASVGGFYIEKVEPGDHCKKGDEIAVIVDHLGVVRETVTAPEDGIVLWIRRLRTVNPGEETMIFGPIEETLVP